MLHKDNESENRLQQHLSPIEIVPCLLVKLHFITLLLVESTLAERMFASQGSLPEHATLI